MRGDVCTVFATDVERSPLGWFLRLNSPAFTAECFIGWEDLYYLESVHTRFDIFNIVGSNKSANGYD